MTEATALLEAKLKFSQENLDNIKAEKEEVIAQASFNRGRLEEIKGCEVVLSKWTEIIQNNTLASKPVSTDHKVLTTDKKVLATDQKTKATDKKAVVTADERKDSDDICPF
jgi:hypothetical protein